MTGRATDATPVVRVDLPELDLVVELGSGARHDLGVDGATPEVLEARVACLTGRRGPWRPRRLVVEGRSLGHRRTAARVRGGVVTIAPPVLAPQVSVRDHLAAAAPVDVAEARLAQVPRLAGRADVPAGVLSGGERQLVAWARAALVEPRVVVLDRAATGLDDEALAWATAQLDGWCARGGVALVRVGRAEEAAWTDASPPNGRAPGPHR